MIKIYDGTVRHATSWMTIQYRHGTPWGSKRITQGLFLDVSSAFDKVWHNGLLAKLAFYDTLHSYLTNRKQVVVVEGQKSNFVEIKAGGLKDPG